MVTTNTACVFLPLLAAIIAGLFGRVIGDRGAQVVTSGALVISFLLSLVIFYEVAIQGETRDILLFNWVTSGALEFAWALRFDTLTAVMVFVVTITAAPSRLRTST